MKKIIILSSLICALLLAVSCANGSKDVNSDPTNNSSNGSNTPNNEKIDNGGKVPTSGYFDCRTYLGHDDYDKDFEIEWKFENGHCLLKYDDSVDDYTYRISENKIFLTFYCLIDDGKIITYDDVVEDLKKELKEAGKTEEEIKIAIEEYNEDIYDNMNLCYTFNEEGNTLTLSVTVYDKDDKIEKEKVVYVLTRKN